MICKKRRSITASNLIDYGCSGLCEKEGRVCFQHIVSLKEKSNVFVRSFDPRFPHPYSLLNQRLRELFALAPSSLFLLVCCSTPTIGGEPFLPYSSRLSDNRITLRCPESTLPIEKCPRFFKKIRFGIGRIDSETLLGWPSKTHVLPAAPSASTDGLFCKGCVKRVMLRGSGCRPVRSR